MFRRVILSLLPLAVVGFEGAANAATCSPKYIGQLVLQPDANGRSMTVEAPFAFQDASCQQWQVPKGATADGASIPRALWSIIGGPWEGPYRNASVVHDWYCSVRTRPWKAVHRMFFDGMIASGVGSKLAKTMYLAVYYWGPRWDDLTIRNSQLLAPEMKRVNTVVFKAVSYGQQSLASGKFAEAKSSLSTAVSAMQTNGDQFAVGALAGRLAEESGDTTSAAAALDTMIQSGVADTPLLQQLQTRRAEVAVKLGDYETATKNLRQALATGGGQQTVEIFSSLKRLAPAAVNANSEDQSKFQPTELEYQRLANIVEKDSLSLDQIDKLVDDVRKP